MTDKMIKKWKSKNDLSKFPNKKTADLTTKQYGKL